MGKFRSPEALTSLKKQEKVTYCNKATFDIETINWTEPYAIGLYDDQKRYKMFKGKDCIREFIDEFLTKKYRGYVCYAHNGGKFDFSFILKELFQKKYQEKYIIEPMRAASRIIQIDIKTYCEKTDERTGEKKKEVEHVWSLRDSMALFPFSLRKVTENFNVEHKKGEFNHELINWDNWQELEPQWAPYLQDDCRGLLEAVHKFEHYMIDKFSVNLKNSVTLAQLALRVFRTNYIKFAIPNYKPIESDIRKSYFGGRTEIFKMYGEKLNYYDVTSLYPYVMHEKYMPVGKPIKDASMKISDFGICKVDVEAPKDIDIPLLPHKINGKLIFPRGRWTGFYCTPELQKAEKLGYKIKVHYGYKFKAAKIFTSYIDELFKLKQNSSKDSVDYMVSKLLMNSLYGKFGQRREKQQIIMFPTSTIGLEPVDFMGDLPIYSKKVESQAKHILPAIASFVTSYARIHLYEKGFEAAKAKGGNIYYCDTDSIITDVKLNIGTNLGDLTDELPEGIEEGIFLLPKMYGIKTTKGEYVKCKGFPRKMFDYNIYKKAYTTGDMTAFNYSKDSIAAPFESMRRNKTFVSMIKRSRSVIQRYDKRIVTNGIDTIPYTIDQLEVVA
jgi:hypothetical protein